MNTFPTSYSLPSTVNPNTNTWVGSDSTSGTSSGSSQLALLASCEGDESLKIFDYLTGQILQSFSDTSTARNPTAFSVTGGLGGNFLGSSEGITPQGDYIIVAQGDPSFLTSSLGGNDSSNFVSNSMKGNSKGAVQALHIYRWNMTSPLYRCRMPEPIEVIVSTIDGLYVFGGAKCSGNIYVWQVSTGQLIHAFEAHYKGITALCVSSDGNYLVSGSEDTILKVWLMGDLLDSGEESNGISLNSMVSGKLITYIIFRFSPIYINIYIHIFLFY